MNQQELSYALRKEANKNGHAVQTIASGTSMFPFLRKGDILTIDPAPIETIKRGDIVVFENEEKWIAHRVINIRFIDGAIQLTTRGDARISSDPTVNETNYIGFISAFERDLKKNSLLSFRKKIGSKIHLLGGVALSFALNFIARKT
jgi:signal peptidase I